MSRLTKALRGWLGVRRHRPGPETSLSGNGSPPLISVHIPKCAGTSFLKFLGVQYGGALMLDYDEILLDPESPFQKDFVAWNHQQKSALVRDYRQVKAVHGHFWAGKYDAALPGAMKVTFLRDPVRRLVSHYYYWKSKASLPNSLHREFVAKNVSLLEFAEFPIMQNVYTKTFLRENAVDDFEFIGICENLSDDMRRLQRQLGWHEGVLPLENRTAHPDYKTAPLDAAVESRIRKLNEADLDLYHAALDRRKQHLKR